MSNLSILEHNIIASFGSFSDPSAVEGQFFSALGRCGTLDAERVANEFGRVLDTLSPMLYASIKHYVEEPEYGQAHTACASGIVKNEVMAFIQERHLNYRAGGNMKLKVKQKGGA